MALLIFQMFKDYNFQTVRKDTKSDVKEMKRMRNFFSLFILPACDCFSYH